MGLPFAYVFVVGFVFGAITASFLCVVAERVPSGRSIGGRSACACGRRLLNRENVPILGYLRVGGVARCCGARIASYYLWAEVFLALAWAAASVVATGDLAVGTVLAACSAGGVVAVGAARLSSTN